MQNNFFLCIKNRAILCDPASFWTINLRNKALSFFRYDLAMTFWGRVFFVGIDHWMTVSDVWPTDGVISWVLGIFGINCESGLLVGLGHVAFWWWWWRVFSSFYFHRFFIFMIFLFFFLNCFDVHSWFSGYFFYWFGIVCLLWRFFFQMNLN